MCSVKSIRFWKSMRLTKYTVLQKWVWQAVFWKKLADQSVFASVSASIATNLSHKPKSRHEDCSFTTRAQVRANYPLKRYFSVDITTAKERKRTALCKWIKTFVIWSKNLDPTNLNLKRTSNYKCSEILQEYTDLGLWSSNMQAACKFNSSWMISVIFDGINWDNWLQSLSAWSGGLRWFVRIATCHVDSWYKFAIEDRPWRDPNVTWASSR